MNRLLALLGVKKLDRDVQAERRPVSGLSASEVTAIELGKIASRAQERALVLLKASRYNIGAGAPLKPLRLRRQAAEDVAKAVRKLPVASIPTEDTAFDKFVASLVTETLRGAAYETLPEHGRDFVADFEGSAGAAAGKQGGGAGKCIVFVAKTSRSARTETKIVQTGNGLRETVNTYGWRY